MKLFRKIRQNLLVENQVSKYLLYAIGEIVLVVIGILIALQIDNWNEKSNATEETLTYLITLNAEVESNIKFLTYYIEAAHADIVASAETLKKLHAEESIHYSDSMLITVMDTAPIYKPTLSQSAFTDLINSGNLEHVKDQKLKKEILYIEGNIESVYENFHNAKDVWDNYQLPYHMKYGNPAGNWSSISSIQLVKLPYKRTLGAFAHNKEYAGILALRMRMVANLEEDMSRRKEDCIKLSKDIKAYLKSKK
jgi:hypothetical protein